MSRTESLKDYKLYTLTELQEVIGVSHRTLLAYVKKGRIKASKIAGKWRVTEQNLRKFIEGNK